MTIRHRKGSTIRCWAPVLATPIPAMGGTYYEDMVRIESVSPTTMGKRSRSIASVFCKTSQLLQAQSDEAEWKRFLRRLQNEVADNDVQAQYTLATFCAILHYKDCIPALFEDDGNCDNAANQPSATVRDDNQLLQEGWTYLQDIITWKQCLQLFDLLLRRLDIIAITNPLEHFAKVDMFAQDDDAALEDKLGLCFKRKWIEDAREAGVASIHHHGDNLSSRGDCSKEKDRKGHGDETSMNMNMNMLRTSQHLLDSAGRQPQWIVGVIVDGTIGTSASQQEAQTGSPTKSAGERTAAGQDESLDRSCFPSCVVDIRASADGDGAFECALTANFDLMDNDPIDIERRASDSILVKSQCDCIRCRFAQHDQLTEALCAEKDSEHGDGRNGKNLRTLQRVANQFFVNGDFKRAASLYRHVHDTYQSLVDEGDENTTHTTQQNTFYMHQMADAWHAIGALKLAQLKFVSAQKHWRDGAKYAPYCDGLATQIVKLKAYQYLASTSRTIKAAASTSPSDTEANHEIGAEQQNGFTHQENSSAPRPQQQQTLLPFESFGLLHVTHNVVDPTTCKQLIQHAVDHAASQATGWTTSRHYAVPTIDVPVHEVPRLAAWFQTWMRTTMEPLLHRQFGTHGDDQRYYVHDAFLAKYERTATSAKSTFLPLHFDESTHSFVLALNDEYECGGTYVHDYNRVVRPQTGGVVSFRGNKLLHGGCPVTRGTRYILAVFLYLDERYCDEDDAVDGGYSEKHAERKRSVTEMLQSSRDQQQESGGFSFGFF